jgi:histidinol dehydrogenase
VLKEFDGETFRQHFKRRRFDDYPQEISAVREIISQVRRRGDEAVLEYTNRFDSAGLKSLCVSAEEFAAAEAVVDTGVRENLKLAASNIEAFHRRQLCVSWLDRREDGVALGQLVRALERVGAYVPGGGAAYPSSVLMTVIPARVAGVREVVLTTPPLPGGEINPYTLVAARIAGADAVYKCGGAQAVAALAYGTETIPRVDKVVGPGNIYVTLAKREVMGAVGIDMLAGPSEVLVLADNTACAACVAADLLSQAEHDAMASAYFVTDSRILAADVQKELRRQCAALKRPETAVKALRGQGALVLVNSIEEGMSIANELAPEHLELHLAEPWLWLDSVQNAGAVFIGAFTPEAVGDYWAGPNHVLPTAGAARFSSPLSVDDYIKKSSVIYYPAKALLAAAPAIESLAGVEGLDAHGLSVKMRRDMLEKREDSKD